MLNPGGRDREQAFPQGAGIPDSTVHPPVNYHAYAACTGGTFYHDPARIPATQREVLLILRRDLKHCLNALQQLKTTDKIVAVSLKESGLHQVATLFENAENLRLFREICAAADGCIASTPELVGIYEAAGGKQVRYIPTPYPVESEPWKFALPLAERAGVFIGTREWETPSRNHAAALLLAGSLGAPVTVVNDDGRSGRKRIESAGLGSARIIEGRTPYPEYLKLVATHRIVLQLDRSAVPGQVAGDALLCGLPCVGGDGAIDRIAFPYCCGLGRTLEQIREIASCLLRDDEACAGAASRAANIALDQLGFAAVSKELARYFAGV